MEDTACGFLNDFIDIVLTAMWVVSKLMPELNFSDTGVSNASNKLDVNVIHYVSAITRIF